LSRGTGAALSRRKAQAGWCKTDSRNQWCGECESYRDGLWRVCRAGRRNRHRRRIGSCRHSRCINIQRHRTSARSAQNAGCQPCRAFCNRPVQRASACITNRERLSAWIAAALRGREGKVRRVQTNRRSGGCCDGKCDGDGLRGIGCSCGCNRHCAGIVSDGQPTHINADGK
jgi:hypothetical protein